MKQRPLAGRQEGDPPFDALMDASEDELSRIPAEAMENSAKALDLHPITISSSTNYIGRQRSESSLTFHNQTKATEAFFSLPNKMFCLYNPLPLI